MGGPSGSQQNKAHKAGRKAGISARQKQKQGKQANVPSVRPSVKSTSNGSRSDRLMATKQHRDVKRQELLDRKRQVHPPLVVAVLPLSADADVARLWHGLLAALEAPSAQHGRTQDGSVSGDMDIELSMLSGCAPCMTTICVGGRARQRVTLLPPPGIRNDPLAVVEMARAAEIVLLLVAAGEGQTQVDADGMMALTILQALGLPSLMVAVQSAAAAPVASSDSSLFPAVAAPMGVALSGAAASVASRERSAGKKRAEKALTAQVAGEHRYLHADSTSDMSQMVRHLSEVLPSVPSWKHQRPSLMLQDATFTASDTEGENGTLQISGFLRFAGLSANQLISIPGAGDYPISAIYGPTDPFLPSSSSSSIPLPSSAAHTAASAHTSSHAEMDTDGSSPGAPLIAQSDPAHQQGCDRENVPDETTAEQTWPSEQELMDAEVFEMQTKRRKVPRGTSDYQAAWIMDNEYADSEEDDADDAKNNQSNAAGGSSGPFKASTSSKAGTSDGSAGPRKSSDGSNGMDGGEDDDIPDLELADDDGAGTEGGQGMDEEYFYGGADDPVEEAKAAALFAEIKSRKEEDNERTYPDEVEVPIDGPARVRFQKYRGLKSFRSSPWDPKESLPSEYARVFAFENFKRAHKRALEAISAATAGSDPSGVAPGSYICVHLRDVPPAVAAAVLARVQASLIGSSSAGEASGVTGSPAGCPVVCMGLLAHEHKLSVVNFSVKKANAYEEVLKSKEELLFVTALRSFKTNPIYSSDSHGADKHKFERFLHPGVHCVAAAFAPISYAPLPLLAFKLQPDGKPAVLAASGSLRGCDPDRVVLKKIVLTGHPMRVHKCRATVRFMFHTPEDIRWFKPVELYTKHGRRGRITEPLGTHGAMKCMFDGPVQQFDVVCMSLYKRVYPRWPEDTSPQAFV